MDYNYYDYGTSNVAADSGVIAAVFGTYLVFSIISLAISIFMLVCTAKIFKKKGKPGWYAIIPFLNTWTLFEIGGLPGWLSLIPFVNAICVLIASYNLAKAFNKSSGFGIGLIFLPIIFYPILAFEKNQMNNEFVNQSGPVNNYTAPQPMPNTMVNENPYVDSTINQSYASPQPAVNNTPNENISNDQVNKSTNNNSNNDQVL